jgi:hypothetical protein
MFDISIKSNVDQISKELSYIAYKQLPYALAKTVNSLAKIAQDGEKRAILSLFSTPTPFTVNSVAIKKARKDLPIATVFIKDKAAKYLDPYEFGGIQYLGKKPADLVPVAQAANQYGNLPRGILAKYKNRKDCFIGTIKTKRGNTFGLWQRPTSVKMAKGVRQRRTANTTGQLKLLVAFHKPVEVKKHLNFGIRAKALVDKNMNAVFGAELAKAIRTAK